MVLMRATVVKVSDIFRPDEEILVMEVGDLLIIKRLRYEEILKRMGKAFSDLSEEEKERLAVEAKKWAREDSTGYIGSGSMRPLFHIRGSINYAALLVRMITLLRCR